MEMGRGNMLNELGDKYSNWSVKQRGDHWEMSEGYDTWWDLSDPDTFNPHETHDYMTKERLSHIADMMIQRWVGFKDFINTKQDYYDERETNP